MSMTVKRRKDVRTPKVLMHKIADIRGGVSVNVSELGDDYLPEGAVLSAPVSGVCHVVKVAVAYEAAAADATTLKVKKGHNFQVNDIITPDAGGKSVKVTAIDKSNASYDAFTIAEAVGAVALGAALTQAAEEYGYYACESGDEGALKVVTADAADGQILKASVTPWRGEGSSPNANTYVVYKTSALKYAPLAVNGTGKPVRQGENLDTDAWLMAVTKGLTLPASVAAALRGVINY